MGIICKYKFDSSIYADLIPEFNSGYSDYVITDEVEGNIITRTIESDKSPTVIRFGRVWVNGETGTDNRTDSLLEVIALNVSVTNASSMFRYCKNLTSLNVSGFDTSNVTNMSSMFQNCKNLISLDVSGFDTTKVTHMDNMFNGCSKLTELDVSGFDTSNVTQINGMFNGCANLKSLDLSGFDTANVTLMDSTFAYCSKLTSLDISSFDTAKVTNMSYMFKNCSKLTELDVSGFDTSNVTQMQSMFQDCSNLTSLNVSGFNTGKVIHMGSMFYNCSNLTSLDVSGFNTSNVTYMHYMFTYCTKLTNLDLSGFDTVNVTRMEYIFFNCSSLTSLDVSSFNTSKVSDTTSMFANTNSLEVITMFNNDINTINTIGNLTSATIYVDESLDQSQYTGTAPLKVYKEEKLEIKLNSPLLEGDTIEVVDDKICHYHKMSQIMLDGSEDEDWKHWNGCNGTFLYRLENYSPNLKANEVISNTLPSCEYDGVSYGISRGNGYIAIKIDTNTDVNIFKQYLQENPIIAVYELETPIYEDITPLQSSLVLKTFLESSMTIDTILPIETKLSYRTNVPSISTLSTRATELTESDNVIHNLMNIIDDEVDE